MARQQEFQLPPFYNYPPYFTLQPVRETRERQVALWKDLILRYCQHHRIFLVDTASFPLFQNESIQRKLTFEARVTFLAALASEGRVEWLDKQQQRCWVHWRKAEEWANVLWDFVESNGMTGSVMTIDEICRGDDTKGTELEGVDLGVMVKAVKVLEERGKAVMFKGSTADDEGVKFLS